MDPHILHKRAKHSGDEYTPTSKLDGEKDHGGKRDESHVHLFGGCSFTKLVWERLMQWIRIHVNPMQSYTQMIAWVITQAKGKLCKAKILKMVYAEHIYGIWRERNSRIFEETTRTADQIAREVACVCNIRVQGGMRAQMQQLIF
ncbi:uncharacterized protein LOC142181058 [Nicotiana tabacum]|uniref:Uncharacterized protein LOC142181058 n=1 Tax=Nicotiana tabacum TaxID=4097 RepID=A0AC58UIF6_TOBAC